MAYLAQTKGFSWVSPCRHGHAAAPFWCTHPPPPIPLFLLMQNLSTKDIAGCDIMKLKVSYMHHWLVKG